MLTQIKILDSLAELLLKVDQDDCMKYSKRPQWLCMGWTLQYMWIGFESLKYFDKFFLSLYQPLKRDDDSNISAFLHVLFVDSYHYVVRFSFVSLYERDSEVKWKVLYTLATTGSITLTGNVNDWFPDTMLTNSALSYQHRLYYNLCYHTRVWPYEWNRWMNYNRNIMNNE